MSDRARLLDGLRRRAAGRARVQIDVVWEAFREAVRGYTGSAEARAHLFGLLGSLEDEGVLRLPRGRHLWDGSAHPALPAWVQLAGCRGAPTPSVDHRAVAWPPELAFAAELPRAPWIDELLAIRSFLANGGRSRRHVPLTERSLELFGDEKRLSNLCRSSLFGPGRVSLELLRCHEVAPPLVWELGPAEAIGRPVIVLENLGTYDSFGRWNAQAGEYAAVAYGHGTEFVATVRDLPRVCARAQTSTVAYFGDLDANGLAIPYRAREVLAAVAPEIDLRPAERWYAALLDHAALAQRADAAVASDDVILSWLPEPLRARGAALLGRGRRLPQEHIGLDHLLD